MRIVSWLFPLCFLPWWEFVLWVCTLRSVVLCLSAWIKAFSERLAFKSVWQLAWFLSYLLLVLWQRFRASRGVDLTWSLFPTKYSFAVFGFGNIFPCQKMQSEMRLSNNFERKNAQGHGQNRLWNQVVCLTDTTNRHLHLPPFVGFFTYFLISDARCSTAGAQLIFGLVGDYVSQRFPCFADLI